MKTCTTCHITKPESEFGKGDVLANGERRYRSSCRSCCNASQRASRIANRLRAKAKNSSNVGNADSRPIIEIRQAVSQANQVSLASGLDREAEQEAQRLLTEERRKRVEAEELLRRLEGRDVDELREEHSRTTQVRALRREIQRLIDANRKLEGKLEVFNIASTHEPRPIDVRETRSGLHEATAVAMASDWHIEKQIDADTVDGRNAFNLEIMRLRVSRYVHGTLALIRLHRQRAIISNLVLALIGDLIQGYLHDEDLETNALAPPQAIVELIDVLIYTIDAFLADEKLERIVIPCVVGNHGRTTQKWRPGTAVNNSYEWIAYQMLARHYRDNERVEFTIAESIMTHVQVYDRRLRIEHGNAFNYQGGVGGIWIGFNKHIARRNDATESFADITMIGHWHQLQMLRHGMVNGSLCGYDPYAVSRGLSFELAAQGFYLIDSKEGAHSMCPLWVQRRDDSETNQWGLIEKP